MNDVTICMTEIEIKFNSNISMYVYGQCNSLRQLTNFYKIWWPNFFSGAFPAVTKFGESVYVRRRRRLGSANEWHRSTPN